MGISDRQSSLGFSLQLQLQSTYQSMYNLGSKPLMFLCIFLSMNIPPRNEGYYTHSFKVGGILHLWVGIRSLPLLWSAYKNPPPGTPHDMHVFWFVTIFALCCMMGETWLRDILKGLGYHLVLGPFIWECPILGLYICTLMFCILAYKQPYVQHLLRRLGTCHIHKRNTMESIWVGFKMTLWNNIKMWNVVTFDEI